MGGCYCGYVPEGETTAEALLLVGIRRKCAQLKLKSPLSLSLCSGEERRPADGGEQAEGPRRDEPRPPLLRRRRGPRTQVSGEAE